MKILLLLLGAISFSTSLFGQTHTVRVVAEGAESKQVSDAVEARLGGASRYTVIADKDRPVEITVDILCLTVGSPSKGWACSYTFEYVPPSMFPLSTEIGIGGLSVGGNYIEIAEQIFSEVVKGSSEESLKQAQGILRLRVVVYCMSPEHHETCSPPATAKEK